MGADGGPVNPNPASHAETTERAGLGLGEDFLDRTVQFSFSPEACTHSQSTNFSLYPEQVIIDVGSAEAVDDDHLREWPFKMRMKLGQEGTAKMSVWGTVGGGAMLCVLNSTLWAQIEHRFGRLRESPIVCRMAHGTCVPSMGTGVGQVRYHQAVWPIRFEVIDSKGAFELLMGKDWLKLAGVTQFYPTDTLSLCSQGDSIYIDNANPKKKRPERRPQGPRPSNPNRTSPAVREEASEEQQEPMPSNVPRAPEPEEMQEVPEKPGEPVPRRSERLRARRGSTGGNANPFRVTEAALAEVEAVGVLDDEHGQSEASPEELWARAKLDSEAGILRDVMHADEVIQEERTTSLEEVLARAKRNMEHSRGPIDIAFTEAEPAPRPKTPVHQPPIPESDRISDPFKPERLEEILRKVKIGDGISAEQRSAVEALIREYGDIFALNLSEVLTVSFAEMKFDIPEGTTFPKRPGQRKLSEPQRQALYALLDEMEAAKIIKRVSQDQVEAVSPINMVPKPGGSERPSLETLQRMANSECRKYSFPVTYPDVGFYDEAEPKREGQPAKW
ncbi:hypothetical protein FRC12_002841 [Ceratobasidium sp. 428]|nr:hypothetical protein FRC12_002841 [Ceratobasidium sp. 428]